MLRDLTNDEATFCSFLEQLKFLCDFETGPLKVIFQFARPVDTFFDEDFANFSSIKDKEITKGHFI